MRIGPLEVCPIQLPGRENRIRQPAFGDFASFAKATAEGLLEYLDRPYAVIGHCMGALLAHALVLQIERQHMPVPSCLFLSSSRPACLPPEKRYRMPEEGSTGIYHPSLPDERLASELSRVSAGLGHGEMLKDLIPLAIRVLRADLDMCFGYSPGLVEPVSCPITVISWADDEDVRPDEMRGWQRYGAARQYTLPGGKLSFFSAPAELCNVIESEFMSSEQAGAIRQ